MMTEICSYTESLINSLKDSLHPLIWQRLASLFVNKMNKLLLISSCVVAVIADMLFVWWAKRASHPMWSAIIGIILLNAATIIWMHTMKKGIESATAITFYALFTVAGCSFLGFVIFKEPLSLVNGFGIVLAIVALILISI